MSTTTLESASAGSAKVLNKSDKPIGVAHYPGYTVNERAMMSLASVDEAHSKPGTELLLVWGEEQGGEKSSDIGEMVFLPRIIEHLRVQAPHAMVRSSVMPPSDLALALEQDQLDLAIGYFPDLKGSNVFQQKLFAHGFVCLVRANHPNVGKRLTRKQFLELVHAVVHADGRSQEVFERRRPARRCGELV